MVSIIPVVGITIYSTLTLTDSYTSDRLEQLNAIGHNKADALVNWFGERRGDCDFMTKTPSVRNLAYDAGNYGTGHSHMVMMNAAEEIEEVMQVMINVYGTYTEMYLLNTSGYIVAQQSAEGWGYGHSKGADQSTKEYFTAAYAQRTDEEFTYLSDFRWSSDNEYIQIVTSSVIHDMDGNFVGVVVFYIDSTYVDALMQATEGLGSSGETYLVNHEGYWLTVSKFDYYTAETGLYNDLSEIILTEQLTSVGIVAALANKIDTKKPATRDYRGIHVMGSYSYLLINSEGLPWILVAEIDVSEALKVVNDLTTISIWIVVIIGVIVAVIGYVIAKKFTDPIIKLNTLSIRVAEGDLIHIGDDGKVRKGNDEIAVLGRSFGTMTENIRDII
ncbi:hypothetical protein LCGC14_2319330, partial [marine sediment metagenome]